MSDRNNGPAMTFPPIKKSAALGLAIQNARLSRRMTQDDLCRAIGVSQSQLSNWEAGGGMRPASYYKVLDFFGAVVGDPLAAAVAIGDVPLETLLHEIRRRLPDATVTIVVGPAP